MQKYKKTQLSDKQKASLIVYKRTPDTDIVAHNVDKKQFVKCRDNELKEWLINEKTFKAEKINKLFDGLCS